MGCRGVWIVLLALLVLPACTQMQLVNHAYNKATYKPAPYQAPPVTEKRKVGKPYEIFGKMYYPVASSEGYREKGIASWYGKEFHGRKTANGERYNMYAISAAHPTLPLPTWARVTNLENGLSVLVRINDRGPFLRGRLIDLSYGAARVIDMVEQGTAPVLVEALPTDGSPLRPTPIHTRTASRAPQSVHPKAPEQRYSLTRSQQQPVAEVPASPRRGSDKYLESVDLYIQTGAFADLENAREQQRKLERLAGLSYGTLLVRTEKDGQVLHRVRVGPIHTTNAADEALVMLVNAGFNTAILVVD